VADELLLLTVHGVLHLLGYDHDSAEEEQQMWALQEEILSAMGVSGLSERSYDN
jgi:probable rRNA maturation factor